MNSIKPQSPTAEYLNLGQGGSPQKWSPPKHHRFEGDQEEREQSNGEKVAVRSLELKYNSSSSEGASRGETESKLVMRVMLQELRGTRHT